MKEKFDRLSDKCSKITTELYSTSFSFGIRLLSKELRQPIYSIYGFVRLADEIVDSFHEYDKSFLLGKFREDCFEAIALGISLNPVLNAFQKVVNDYRIEHSLIDLFLKSMEMDLGEHIYTNETYEQYILGSAQAVGLMCLYVFTNGDKEAFESLKVPAMKLGSAFQKVNFLRDIGADHYELNRTYFPGVTSFEDENKKIIEQQIRSDFDVALRGIRKLPSSSKKGVYLAYIYYKKLFHKITTNNAKQVMAGRIRISNSHKCWLMLDSLIRYKLNVL
jgi:phytoene/squalene synthetase